MEGSYYIEYAGQALELPVGETVVGRDVGCRLRFNDPAVSRRHLRLVRRGLELFIEDLGSSNGTLVNGAPIAGPTELADGDTVIVGGVELAVRRYDPGDAPELSDTVVRGELASAPPIVTVRTTKRIAVVTAPPASRQRCPQCGGAVAASDDACEACGFTWGGFRAHAHTDVRGVHLRRHDRCAVELHLVYVSSELEIEATTRDLSPGGVFVCTQVLDPVGTRCELTLLVDGGPPLQVAGVVRRVVTGRRDSGLGVEFTGVGPAERAWIEALIARTTATP